jgi:uncharacterized protein with gpF-like domain
MSSAVRIKQVAKIVPDVWKEWMHSHQGIPRLNHLFLDGQRVRANEMFELMGEDGVVYRISGPHDPRLPAGEVINCKCTFRPVVERFQKKT